MASTKQVKPKLVDEYNEEGDFSSITTNLRKQSSDTTPLTDNFVSFYRNVVDMIDGDDDGSHGKISNVESVTLEDGSQVLKITYADGTTKTIADNDKYIDNVTYENGSIILKRNDGASYAINLGAQYYTKAEVDSQVSSKVENAVEEKLDSSIEEMVEEKITSKVEDVVDEKIDSSIEDLVNQKVEEALEQEDNSNKWEKF